MTFEYPLVDKCKDHTKSLAEIICEKICTGFNQHAIVMIEGKTGTGKSNAALDFAFNVSLHMADRLGGRPEDYFTTENVAILTGEEVIRVAKNIKQHGIYILDDIGAEGLNARNWQSDINAVMTKILQTFRTKENLLIMTVPDRGFVDKIARNLLHYKIVMKQAWFSRGITLAKLSTVTKQYSKDGGNNNYPFIRHGNIVYNYAVFKRAPKHLIDSYEEARHAIEEKMRLDSIKEFEENLSKNSNDANDLGNVAELAKDIFHVQCYNSYLSEGHSAKESASLASLDSGRNISERHTQRIRKNLVETGYIKATTTNTLQTA